MNSVVMWIGGVVAAVLAALFAVPHFIDWSSYRGVFEEEASRIFGRDVRVGGRINVRFLPTPYVKFEKLRIADTRPDAVEPIFRAESFTLWLSVPPLLQGNLEARHLALDQPVLTLSVNETGTGNWTELGIRPGTLPFMPQKVALQAVDITGGELVLRHPRAGEVGRVTGIEGEVSAGSLSGPFKIAADAEIAGAAREIRVVTAPADADGTLRFKATARGKSTHAYAYQLDGSLTGLGAVPLIDGVFSAALPLPELPGTASAAAVPPGGAAPPPDSPAAPAAVPAGGTALGIRPTEVFADVRGRLHANADRIELTELTASIENVGQPQLLTGQATLEWGMLKRLDFAFASRWLDLDRLAGSTGRASPLASATALISGLARVLPRGRTTRGVLEVDQMSLGGEALARVDLAVSRVSDGDLRIERFNVALPAGSRMALEGLVSEASAPVEPQAVAEAAAKAGEAAGTAGGQTSGLGFDGRVTLAGPSLKRLSTWASPDSTLTAATPDLGFTFDGRLSAGANGIGLSEARGSLGEHAFAGGLNISASGDVSLTAEADVIETDWLWTGGLSRRPAMAWVRAASAALGHAARETDAAGRSLKSRGQGSPADKSVAEIDAAATGAATSAPRLDLKLRTGVLRGPQRTLRDVIADLSMAEGALTIRRLAFRGGEGIALDVDGRLADTATGPSGRLSGVVAAQDAKALEAMLALFDSARPERLAALGTLTPLRLAGELSLGERHAGAADVKADGAAGPGRMALRAALDGGLGPDWRAAPAEITFSAEDTPAPMLMGMLLGDGDGAAARDASAGTTATTSASIAFKAVGVPAAGMVTDAALSRPGLTLAFNGRTRLDGEVRPAMAGTLEVAAERVGDVLALFGNVAGRPLDQQVTGTLGLGLTDDGRARLTPSRLTVAGAEVSGTLTLGRAGDGRLGVEGGLQVDQASVAGLMSGLLAAAPRPAAVTAADAARDDGTVLWSDQPFLAEAFERFEGEVTIDVARLAVAPQLALADARLQLALKPAAVDAVITRAGALGGRLTGEIRMRRAAAGARLDGRLELTGTTLATLAEAAGGTRKAGGTAGAELKFSGQALSPRSLVGALAGSGKLVLADASVEGFSPQIVAETAAAAFAKQLEISTPTLESALMQRLGTGRLPLGSREVALGLADGALRIDRFTTPVAAGSVETLVTLDVQTMQAETEWRIAANDHRAGKPPWPPVNVYYTGALSALNSMEPRLALGSFERELTVRRMEFEVEELERLRREDEERARLERERQAALEAERQRLAEEEAKRRAEEDARRQAEQAARQRAIEESDRSAREAAERRAAEERQRRGETAPPPARSPTAAPDVMQSPPSASAPVPGAADAAAPPLPAPRSGGWEPTAAEPVPPKTGNWQPVTPSAGTAPEAASPTTGGTGAGAAAADPPPAADGTGADTATITAPRPRRAIPTKPPSANDTLLRSLNQSF